jgi:hypothetical protein
MKVLQLSLQTSKYPVLSLDFHKEYVISGSCHNNSVVSTALNSDCRHLEAGTGKCDGKNE